MSTLTTSPYFLSMLFGLGAIGLARNPDGVLSAAGLRRQEKRRAKERKAKAELRRSWSRARPKCRGSRRHRVRTGRVRCRSVEVTSERRAPTSPAPDDCVLVLEDIVAGYGDAEVLHGLSIAVRPGEIMAVLGRNGAGKSTLCNVAAGAVTLTSGHVVLAGDDVSAQPAFVRSRTAA